MEFIIKILTFMADRLKPFMTPEPVKPPEDLPEGRKLFGIGGQDDIPHCERGITAEKARSLMALTFQKTRADLKVAKPGSGRYAQDSYALPVKDIAGSGDGIGRDIIYTFFAKQCWIGYKNCSLLLQNWLINRCCSIPAEDAVAGGYRLEYADNNTAAGSNEAARKEAKKKADLLPKIQAAAERKYDLSGKLRQLCFNRAGYGTGIAYFVIDGEDPATPLNPDGIRPGSFRGITIIEPQWCEALLSENSVLDPLSPDWYRPEWYTVNGKTVHKSRLFTTVYREVPDDLKPTYHFGGMPLPQMLYERVYSAEKTANEILELVQTKRTFVMQGNTQEIAKNPRRFENIFNALSRFRNNQSIMVVDRTDENFTQMDTALTDVDNITWTLYQLVSGVASIPEYKLFGTNMKGFNSTGEGETRNYLQMLRGMQENVLEPFLRKAYSIICRSDLGNREKYDIVFNPLSVPTEAEQAATQGAKSSYYGNLINAGVVSPEEVRQALRQDENSGFTDIAEDLPEDTGGMGGGMPGNENGGQPPMGGNGGNTPEAKAQDSADNESNENWKTLYPNGKSSKGQKVKLNEEKEIEAGLGGEHNGETLQELVEGNGKPEEKKEEEQKEEESDKTETGKTEYDISGTKTFAEYASKKDDPNITPEKVLDSLQDMEIAGTRYTAEEIRAKIKETDAAIKAIKKDTKEKYKTIINPDGSREYTPEREEIHISIITELFKNAEGKKPKNGEKPTFIILGGRGGSGKSQFEGEVYDKDKFLVLNSDLIKEMLPEYKGWNANEVHNESSYILDQAITKARTLGLNIVWDTTMSYLEGTLSFIEQFKKAGYNTEAHYMYLPRQKSAQRAIGRFLDPNDGRYVPLNVLLGMTQNEQNFDKIKDVVDAWSFSDNDVKKGDSPTLIAKNGDMSYKKGDKK